MKDWRHIQDISLFFHKLFVNFYILNNPPLELTSSSFNQFQYLQISVDFFNKFCFPNPKTGKFRSSSVNSSNFTKFLGNFDITKIEQRTFIIFLFPWWNYTSLLLVWNTNFKILKQSLARGIKQGAHNYFYKREKENHLWLSKWHHLI